MRMPIRSLFAVIAAAALAVLATIGMSPVTASAASYGVVSGAATASATTVARGDSVTVAGADFCPGTPVTLTVSNSGTVYITKQLTADSAGDVSTEVSPTKSGTNTASLRGQTSDCNGQTQVLGVKISVGSVGSGTTGDDSKNASGAGNLPKTGGVDLTPLWAGLGLLFAGSLLVAVAQSRRRITI